MLEHYKGYIAKLSLVGGKDPDGNTRVYADDELRRRLETKLRKLAEQNVSAGWVLMNGNRIQIKRKHFEKFIDNLETI